MKKPFQASITLVVTDNQIKRLREPNDGLLVEDDEGDVGLQFHNVVKLMICIKNVYKHSLNSETLEMLSLCCDTIPVFNNLKFLGVAIKEGREWQAMPTLLRKCPHLEAIITEGLLHYVTDKCGDACPCIPSEDKFLSLTYCPVNRLEIQGFRATMKEMNMIEYFMEYFPCLKRLAVYIEVNEPTQLKNPKVSDCMVEMFELYNELSSSCSFQLLVNDDLEKKWNA